MQSITSNTFCSLRALCEGALCVKCLAQLADDRMKWRAEARFADAGLCWMGSPAVDHGVGRAACSVKSRNGLAGQALLSQQINQKGPAGPGSRQAAEQLAFALP